MKTVVPGRCAIYTRSGTLTLDLTSKGDFTDENAYENVSYEERDGRLYIDAEQLQPVMYKIFLSSPYSTEDLDDLHPSRIKTKRVRKYWLFGPWIEKRYAETGWQRLKNNKPRSFVSNHYTIIQN